VNIFELLIFDDTGSRCTFYTVKQDGHELSETDKFFDKCRKQPHLVRPLQELAKFLSVIIASEKGALPDFFRFENKAQALPPSGKYVIESITINYGNFPLRLYCLRITDGIVILFNGGEKTSEDAQEGKTSMAFHEANRFAERIMEALNEGWIFISKDGRYLESSDGKNELVIS
jgi:hypothetical protein